LKNAVECQLIFLRHAICQLMLLSNSVRSVIIKIFMSVEHTMTKFGIGARFALKLLSKVNVLVA
jgi:hypothetical protein